MNRDGRLAAVQARMQAEGIDLLVCASNGLHQLDLPNPVAHMTGFRSIGPSLALIAAGEKPALLSSPAIDSGRLPRTVEGTATDDLPSAFKAALAHRGSRRVAEVGMGALPYRLVTALLAGLRVAPAPWFDEVTGPKTAGEIAAAERAAVIAEESFDRLNAMIRPGMRECDIAVELKIHMKEQGANDSFLMLSAAARADAIMPSTERPIEIGDLVLMELSPCVDGQFVQICRTSVVGPPAPVLTERYDLLARALQAGIAQAKPGLPMGGVCQAIDDTMAEAGFAQFSRPPFIRRRGHGLGAGSVAPGDVASDNTTLLEPGMMFVVHPNQPLPETGYLMCGEPVLIGADGPIVMTRRPPALSVIDV